MRCFLIMLLFAWILPISVEAAPLRVEITYTNGYVVSGPLTSDLEELPASVTAWFILADAGGTLDNVLDSSLVFGDGEWNAADLNSFLATFLPTDSGGLAVTSLSYAYRPKNTPTSNGKLAANFPLEIEGTDVASGLPFHYRYETSSQTVTVIPEPSGLALAALGAAVVAVAARACRRPLLRTALPSLILALTVCGSFLWAPSAGAGEIVFDTFGPGNSYSEDFKYSSGSFHFSPIASGVLESISVALGRPSTETIQASFSLMEETVPNTFVVLESWIVPNDTPPLPSPGTIVSFDSVAQPTLLAGHSYWLGMGHSFHNSLWFMNDQGIGQAVYPFTTTLPAFRVEVVPEPSARFLLIAGVVLLGGFAGFRSCAVRAAAPILRSLLGESHSQVSGVDS